MSPLERQSINSLCFEIESDIAALMPEYLEDLGVVVQNISEALAGGNFSVVHTFGHNLAGNGGAYGFPIITEIGRKMEAAAKAHDVATIETCAADLKFFLEHVKITYV